MHLSSLFICLAKTDLREQSIGRERIFFSSLCLSIYLSLSLARSLARARSLCLSLTRARARARGGGGREGWGPPPPPPPRLRPTKRVARECTPLLMHEDQKVLSGRSPLRMSEASDSRETKGRGRGTEGARVYWDRYSMTGGAILNKVYSEAERALLHTENTF
jgi:hypothetical protein